MMSMKRVAVSFSVGVDSTVLLAAAADALPNDHIAVFADIALLSERQRKNSYDIAARLNANIVSIELSWDDMPFVRDNGADRCYHCKRAIYSAVERIASANGYDICVDGENLSDRPEERPGRRAAVEFGIRSPLKDLGIERDVVDKMLADLRLSVNIQKETCMATRLPQSVPFTEKDVRFVEECEDIIRSISGVRQIRMRLTDSRAQLLASPDETEMLVSNEEDISSALYKKGIRKICIDMNGYRG